MVNPKNIPLFLKSVFVVLLLIPTLIHAEDAVTIVSDGIAEFDAKNKRAVFRDNVLVTRKNNGSTLRTDKLVVTKFPDGSRTILEAEGGVKAINPSPSSDLFQRRLTIVCDWLYLDSAASLLRLKGGVIVKSVDYELEGDKAEYDYLSEKGAITSKDGRQVRFAFSKNEKTKPDSSSENVFLKNGFKATATEIFADNPNRRVALQGKAAVIDDENEAELKAERIEITFDSAMRAREVVASGKFSMSWRGRRASAERAVFQNDEQTIILSGDAYVKEKNGTEIRSSGIEIFMKDGESVVRSLDDTPIKMEIPLRASPR